MRIAPVPRLVASRVACMRSGQVVIRDVNMTLHEGGAMLLTGPNGSGKSTFLRLLAGFLKPSAGQLLWDGHDLSGPGLYDGQCHYPFAIFALSFVHSSPESEAYRRTSETCCTSISLF